jgi:hypothetical protein
MIDFKCLRWISLPEGDFRLLAILGPSDRSPWLGDFGADQAFSKA